MNKENMYLLLAGALGGYLYSRLKGMRLIEGITPIIAGAFSSLFFANVISMYIYEHFLSDTNINIESYLSGTGFFIGLVVMIIADFIIKFIEIQLTDRLESSHNEKHKEKSELHNDESP